MSLYDTLKAAKIGAAPDVYTILRAQQAPFAKNKYTEKEIESIPPISFSANGENLIAYSIDGNFSYSGTPTSESPIFPNECGNLVESGTQSGKYVLPILCGGATTNYYLNEPIRKFGAYIDSANNVAVTRKIKKLVLTGNESIDVSTNGDYTFFQITLSNFLSGSGENSYCSHFAYNAIYTSNTDIGYFITSGGALRIRPENVNGMTKAEFASWIADQYAANTPVTFYYILSTEETESVTAPSIPTTKGSNTLTIDTTIQPSSVYIKYKG